MRIIVAIMLLSTVCVFFVSSFDDILAQPAPFLGITDLDGNPRYNAKVGQQLLISHYVGYGVSTNNEKQCIVQNITLNCSPIMSESIVIGDKIHQGTYDDKPFVIIFQVQDNDGRTMYLSWVEGIISPGQIKNMESAWMPKEAGTYTAKAFVWSSIDYPTPLSAPASSTIIVR